MGFVVGTDSRQMTMGVWSVEDEVAQDSPARFIDVFVDSLDLEEMGFRHAVPAGTGRPAYHPGDLLKLYLYGYMNKIRLSRNLMRECGRNVELWFLLNRLQPDFRTIADFRMAHRKLLKCCEPLRGVSPSCASSQFPALAPPVFPLCATVAQT